MKKITSTFIAQAVSSAANGILITDRSSRIVWANQAFLKSCGYSMEEVIGQTPELLNSGKQRPEFYRILWETILSGRPWQGEIIERHKNGSLYTVHQIITPICDEQGQVTHFIACQHNILDLRKEEEELRHLAHYDSLTGLPNRKLFLDVLQHTINNFRFHDNILAVMFIDLDSFKPVNDRYGHAIGDELLIAVADRLRLSVRKSDTIARLGGDEFLVLLADMNDLDIIAQLANKIVNRLASPYMFDSNRIEISASIGISIFPENGRSAEQIIKAADAAMYLAKAKGKNRYEFFCDMADKSKVISQEILNIDQHAGQKLKKH